MHYATDDTFEACKGKLNFLPDKWKLWKTLNDYRKDWAFVKRGDLREIIVETNMTFDYVCSLYLWLMPRLTIETGHKFTSLVLVSSIYEAIINDCIWTLLKDTKSKKLLYKELSFAVGFSKNLGIIGESDILSKEWRKYIKALIEKRNLIHPSKKGKRDTISNLSIEELRDKLGKFRSHIKNKY